MIATFFHRKFQDAHLVLLGFGREGKSTYRLLRRYMPDKLLTIADSNPACKDDFVATFGEDFRVTFCCGPDCNTALRNADVIIKSPGVSFKTLPDAALHKRIVSQTSLFLELYRQQVIGITGTKGKSTTTSILYAMLKEAGIPVLMGGNIGIPPLELAESMTPDTLVVFEMSSHQLENITLSPATGILLNVFQEHLDHYESYRHYQLAKYNIALWQQPGDYFIYNATNPVVSEMVETFPAAGTAIALQGNSPAGMGACYRKGDMVFIREGKEEVIPGVFKKPKLPGEHNLTNILAAATVAYLKGAGAEAISRAVETFSGLPHRLEFVGNRNGTLYYNDSISTIPESTLEALKTFGRVHTLLLGGFDRGVDYSKLILHLSEAKLPCLIFIGKAGLRMMEELLVLAPHARASLIHFNDFEAAVREAFQRTPLDGICLLSPAAASYDMFRNFEHRGEKFRQMVLENK